MATHCLVDYDIRDDSPVHSPAAEYSASGDAHANSHMPDSISNAQNAR